MVTVRPGRRAPMVKRRRVGAFLSRGVVLIALAAGLSGAVVLAPGVTLADEPAEDTVSAGEYDVSEQVRMTVDEVGNTRYGAVLTYDREFFDQQSVNYEEYPFLLSRRYRAMEEVDEIQGFEADLDREAGAVALSFDERGRAYLEGDNWVMYGFHNEPSSIDGGTVLFEEESTVSSDYTLWNDFDFETTTTVELPQGAAEVSWDEDEAALTWEIPGQVVAVESGNVLQRNKAVFIPLFAAMLVGSLGVGAYVLLRDRRS